MKIQPMKLGPFSMPLDRWVAIMNAQRRFALPVYVETGDKEYPTFPNGTGFILGIGGICFICITEHQYRRAQGRRIAAYVAQNRALDCTAARTFPFPASELVMFGRIRDDDATVSTVTNRDCVRPYSHHIHAVATLGFPSALSLTENPAAFIGREGGFLANELRSSASGHSLVLANDEKWSAIPDEQWDDTTNGLSGAPVFALATDGPRKGNESPELRLLGMVHAVSKNPRTVCVVPVWEMFARMLTLVPQGSLSPEQNAAVDTLNAWFDRSLK